MSGHRKGDQDVLHDESYNQSEQSEASKDQVDRKPDDRRRQEGHPRVVATSVGDGAQEDDDDGRNPILLNRKPQQEENEENPQREQHVDPSVGKDRTKRESHADQGFHRRSARLRRQASNERK